MHMQATAHIMEKRIIEGMFLTLESQWTASDVTDRVIKKRFATTILDGPAKKGAREKLLSVT